MRFTAILAIACLVALAFAGCSGKGKDDGGTSTTSSSSASHSATSSSSSGSRSSTSTGSSSSTSTGPAANKAPTGSISASVNGTHASFNLTGNDPDGDMLVWDLAFGDGNATNGTTLPATVSHNYTVSGNLTVNFTVTDGKSPVAYNVTIALGPSGPITLFTFSAAQTAPSNPLSSAGIPNVGYAGATGCAGFASGKSGTDCVFTAFEAALVGKAFTIIASAGDPDYEFWPSCGYDPGRGPEAIFAVGGSNAVGPESGVVPAGAGCVVIWAKSPPAIPTHTFTVTG